MDAPFPLDGLQTFHVQNTIFIFEAIKSLLSCKESCWCSVEPQILEIGILKFSSEDTESTLAVPQLDQHMLMAPSSVSTQQVCL